MTDIKPIFICPECGKNLFDVGVTRCSKDSQTTMHVDFNDGVTTAHKTRILNSSEDWVQCNNCHNGMDIEIYQLDEVLTGEVSEKLMKIRCGMECKPVYNCPKCGEDIFREGFVEVLYGGTSRSEVTMCSDGYDIGDADVVDFDGQWYECSSCDARIDINCIDLINYYEGEHSLDDLEDL